MFGVSDENVLDIGDRASRYDPDEVLAAVGYNQVEPRLLRDGIDAVRIVDESDADDERYRVDYDGYLEGSLTVNRAGLEELGEALLGGDIAIPYWLLSLDEEAGVLPWWIPDGYDPDAHVECAECGDAAAVDAVAVEGDRDNPQNYFCQDCWEERYGW